MKKLLVALLSCCLSLSTGFMTRFNANANPSAAITPSQDFTVQAIQLEPVVTTGLLSPLYVTNAHDTTNRLFIIERGGVIKVLQPGSSTPTVFLDITTRVLSGGERGLLGLAFHPDYSTNRRFFVYYTRQTDGAIIVAEYGASASNPNVANTTETVFLSIPHPVSNHNGGMIEFGPDGYLYIGTGDGGGANDPDNNAQNLNSLLGKILRIDVDNPGAGVPYSSPSTNPFFGTTMGADEIYAYGMRNPWRFSFDRTTGQLYAGDVGQGAREEIDIITLGGNYGWRIMEGTICNPAFNQGNCTPPPGHDPPLAEYSHSGGRCSVTGGYVYRGVQSSLPTGAYVYADYCTGEIFQLLGGTQTLLLDTTFNISSFGESESGEIYVVALGGSVHRIINPSAPPRSTIGVYRPGTSVFYLRNSNSAGAPNISAPFGAVGDLPVVGDWDGDGVTTIGVYRPSNRTFYLNNENATNAPEFTIPYGASGDVPVVGDWDGNGTWTIGVYRPATSTFYLRNSNTAGFADIIIPFGAVGDAPVVGDWDGNATTTIGVYRPTGSVFYLRNANVTGSPDMIAPFGANGDIPVVGDWDGNGTVTIGLYRQSISVFYLRNLNSTGAPNLSVPFGDGSSQDNPIAGNWDGM